MLPYPFKKNCLQILQQYDGKVPFHQYFKLTAQNHKNWGSKDRKRYKAACYGFWKWSNRSILADENNFFKWLEAFFSSVDTSNLDQIVSKTGELGNEVSELGNEVSESAIRDSVAFTETETSLSTMGIPGAHWPKWSQGMSRELWLQWFRQEAPVWVKRFNNDRSLQVSIDKGELKTVSIHGDAVGFAANSSLDFWVEKGDIIIQDIGSQKSMELLPWFVELMNTTKANSSADQHSLQILDCCSGAGGKAITLSANLLKKEIGQSADPIQFELTCSDIRNSILHNLKERFKKTGFPMPKTQVQNWSTAETGWILDHISAFDAVIADIPCSGSGTWRRTPEEAHFFNEEHWHNFNHEQINIVKNAGKVVKAGGLLVVLTCSVFERENEFVIQQLQESEIDRWKILDQGFCGGIEMNGDYIYRTILRKL